VRLWRVRCAYLTDSHAPASVVGGGNADGFISERFADLSDVDATG
jgi:hypothetical protein